MGTYVTGLTPETDAAGPVIDGDGDGDADGSRFAETLVTELDRLSVLTTGDMLRAGVTLAQGRALSALFERGPQRITHLARLEFVSQPAMTSLVLKMERLGLVERLADVTDSRAVIVTLTTRGLETIGALRRARIAAVEQHIAALSPVDVNRLRAAVPVLDHLVALIRTGRHVEADGPPPISSATPT